MARARVLTEGPVRGSLIYLALPLLIGNILQQLYNTADAVIIGRWVNSAAFGAVGVAGTVMNLFIFVLSGACSGITVLFSQAYGAGDLSTFRRELYQSTLFGALFTLALGAMATALLRPLLLVIQTPAELIGYASEYLRIIFAGFLATYAYNLCASALRSAGDTSASLCFLAVSIAANVGLDLLFVAVFGLGIGGAAWATVLAQLLSAAASLVYLRLRHPLLLFRRADMVIDRALLSRTVRFGAVAALHQSSVYIGKLLVQGAVNTLGAEAINAYTAATRIEGFANSFGTSYGAAVSVFISQNFGAKRIDRVRRGFRDSLIMAVLFGASISTMLYFAALPGVVAEGRRVINNIQRSASLFLVKNIFSFLLSIVALALPLAYPFQPLQLSLVTFATIGAPAFFLALEPNHELVHGKFMRNVLRKALPGGLTDFLLVFCAQGFGYAFDIPSDMVGTICTLVILCVGLQILWGVCIPFTPLHWAIWGSMTVAGVGGVFLLARWLPLVRLDLGGTLVLVVLLALSAPTLAGLVFMGERLHGMVNDWKNKKARKHV